jgi:hypothetical protein
MKTPNQIKWIIFGLLFLGAGECAVAQWFKKKNQPVQPPDYGFFLQTKAKGAHLKFGIYANLVVVPVSINESDTLQFILDTGVSSIIITDPAMKDVLNLNYVRKVQISGAGENDAIMAGVSVGNNFRMGDFRGYKQNLVVLEEDVLELSEFIGTPVHGIFGHSLFENYVVSIDFKTFTLSIFKPEKFKFKKRYGDKYPITVTQTKPYTDAVSIVDKNKIRQNMRLVIDTGAGHALLLNPGDHKVILPDKVIRANLGRGLNGELYGDIGRVDKVAIGKYEMNSVLASFPDSVSFSMKFPPVDANRHGSIGGEFLRRFRVTLNYKEGYMALKPYKNSLKEPFEHDMSGIDVRAYADNFHRFYIKYIQENSPAYHAGLQSKDELVYINNKSLEGLNVSDIYKMLSSKAGKIVQIIYRRDGRLGFTSFQLIRAI